LANDREGDKEPTPEERLNFSREVPEVVQEDRQDPIVSAEPEAASFQQKGDPPMSPNQNPPISELNESPWVYEAKEHWKKFCPKLYAELQESGLLQERAVQAAEQTEHDLMSMVRNGYDYQGAWEAVRERYLFLPSEEYEPNLGENQD
jgi:hypothetical protein